MTSMKPQDMKRFWTLDPEVTFLNHGSFGACPRPVLDAQQVLRAEMEREPVAFLERRFEVLLDGAREALAEFVGCDAGGLVFVPNATTGVNAVLSSLELRPGDELLVTDQAYNACRNALDETARRSRARVVVARVPFPLDSDEQVVESVLAAVTPATRVALIDQIASITALRFPVRRLVAALAQRGVETLVDGAHAPGQIELDLEGIGAAYYTGNCHKWLCAPKGAAFLYVREDKRASVRPVVISHGANSPRRDRSRYQLEFGWAGTGDPTPYLSVPAAIEFMGSLLPGGWQALMARNRALALEARDILCRALDMDAPCPDGMIGSMAAFPLADARAAPEPPLLLDSLHLELIERYGIEAPVSYWPEYPRRVLRVSCQVYNHSDEYRRLAEALARE
ncbi:MAG: aminotransferase class V-fold PLP-dependent enzyme [Acidobacteriota bacterium]